MQGKVKWFDKKKGYGFITAADGKEVFVHYSGIAGTGYKALEEGQVVNYDLVDGKKGKQAANVSPV